MSSEVKYIYTNGIGVDKINRIDPGAFVYNTKDERLYLCIPEGAGEKKLAAVSRSVLYVESLESIEAGSYQNNELYLTKDGKLYYYNDSVNTNPQQIALISDVKDLTQTINTDYKSLTEKIGFTSYTNDNGEVVGGSGLAGEIEAVKEIIGQRGVVAGKPTTGLYKIIYDLHDEQTAEINTKLAVSDFNNELNTNYLNKETIEANYYDKNTAQSLFLSADEDIFLTEGYFNSNCEYAIINGKYILWEDIESKEEVEKLTSPCIVLLIKNNTATEATANTIIIPATDLVDVYIGSAADSTKNKNIDVDVTGLTVSANVDVDNLIASANTDTVVLSKDTNNKITTAFNTGTIVDQSTSNTVALSVENNKISGTVIASNLIDSTSNATSLVKLTATGDGKISASLDSATTIALETITKTTERVASINETMNAYGIYTLDANLGRNEYQLYNGVIKTAIDDEATARAAADTALEEAFKEYKESHDALYEAHEQAFEEYKENQDTLHKTEKTTIGTYKYTEATNDNVAKADASGYFDEVKKHLNAEVANLNEQLNSINTNLSSELGETNADILELTGIVEDNKTESQEQIDDINVNLSTLIGRVDNIYTPKTDENSEDTGLLIDVNDRITTTEADLKDYIDKQDKSISDHIDSLYKVTKNTDDSLVVEGIIHTDIENIQTELNKAATYTVSKDNNQADVYTLSAGYVKDYIDGKIDSTTEKIEDNTDNITTLTTEILPEIRGAIAALAGENNDSTVLGNATAINELSTAFDRAINEQVTSADNGDKTYSLGAGYIKSYIDETSAEVFADGISNYYAKIESDGRYVKKDEDLFLTSAELKANYDYYIDTNNVYKPWTENLTQTKITGDCIVLNVRNRNESNDDDHIVIIPANTLITAYTEKNDKDADVEITIGEDYTISAALSTEAAAKLNQVILTGENAQWNEVFTDAADTSLADKVNTLSQELSSYATVDNLNDLYAAPEQNSEDHKGTVGVLINAINGRIDVINTALSEEGDVGAAIGENAANISSIGTYDYDENTQTYTSDSDNTYLHLVNDHITETINQISALADDVGAYTYTAPADQTSILGTGTGTKGSMLAIQDHIDDVIAYVNDKNADLSEELAAHIDTFTEYQNTIGSITVQDNAYTITNDSSYLKLLDTKLLNEINALKTGAVADNTESIEEINTLLNAYGLAPKDTDGSYVLSEGGVVTTTIAANTAAIGVNATNIATNATNIATNTTNIATNTTEIGVNAAAIATKMNLSNPFGTGKFSMNVSSTDDNLLGTNSTTLGSSSLAKGTNSFASGQGVIANGASEHAIGQYNLQTSGSAYLLKTTSGHTMSIGNFDPYDGGSAQTLYYFDGVGFNLETGRIEQSSVYATQATSKSLNAQGSYFYTGGTVQKKIYKIKNVSANNATYSSGTNMIQYIRSWRITYDIYELVPAEQMGYIFADVAFAVGNGTSNANRSNAFTILKDGEAHFTNEVYIDEADGSTALFKSSGGYLSGQVHIGDETDAVKADVNTSTEEAGALIVDGGLLVKKNVIANKVYGSVWNDYAEYRQTHHKVRPGQCVYEKGDGSLAISYERMMPGANIVSDTFGFAIGETDECKTPLAVSGRVLAYPYESKEVYNPGDAVCSGPNGTISKMTRAEIRDYPERIVGTVSEIPTYEVWGAGNIKVNGRIWIKVR